MHLGELVPRNALQVILFCLQMDRDEDAGKVQDSRNDRAYDDIAIRGTHDIRHQKCSGSHDRRHDLSTGGCGCFHGARELAPYIPDEKDSLLPQIAAPASGGSMSDEDKRVLVKALLDLKSEVDALSARVKELEGPGHAQLDRASSDDDAEWQEQGDDLSIRKNTGELIERALEKHGGNVKAAAAELGISERTIYRKLAKNKK